MQVKPENKKWKPDWNCFVNPGNPKKKVPGLTKLLKPLFYDGWSFKNATEGSTLGRSNQDVKKRALADRKSKGGRGTGKVSGKKLQQTGMQMGTEVDQELLALTRELVKTEDSSMSGTLALVSKSQQLSPETVKLWVALESLGLRPISSQTIVSSTRMNIATPLDLLCVRLKSGTLVDVQIKRGYNGYYEKYTKMSDRWRSRPAGRMAAPFDAFHDSCYFQHQLQILYEWLMMIESFVGPKDVKMDAMVLRVDGEGVSKYPLLPELKRLAPQAILVMANRKTIIKSRRETLKVFKKIDKAFAATAPSNPVPFNQHSKLIQKKKTPKAQPREKTSLPASLIAVAD